jgi:hypothetical protein
MRPSEPRPRPATLTLKRESLRELDPAHLVEAAGGAIQTLLPSRCTCTGYYPSWNAPCTV